MRLIWQVIFQSSTRGSPMVTECCLIIFARVGHKLKNAIRAVLDRERETVQFVKLFFSLNYPYIDFDYYILG
ncbi:hypothetical protein MANES_14G094601v8 [Manihot esculenta]|uniref:Uncharacterized protein n=1 Tax=Manihot esculenta TaxID=3983 RepID=A0ACB7GGQ4_MANES|nr:hypothetical protein MANES_14G094601v8 [Manihot esculenta]